MESDEVRRHLQNALDHGGGTHSVEDVLALIMAGEAQIWIEDHAVLVSQIHDTPNHREIHFWLAGGTLDEVIRLSNKVMDWGREQGCTVATLTGRRGWEKVLKTEGWTHRLVELSREL